MPEGRFKSRTFRRVNKRTPGGENRRQYDKRNPEPHKCAKCGAILKGIPRKRPYKMRNMAKTKKRPERPFGGKLCSKCSRDLIKEEARNE